MMNTKAQIAAEKWVKDRPAISKLHFIGADVIHDAYIAGYMAEEVCQPCSLPTGDSGEEYYMKKEDFMQYIEREVNPARVKAGIKPLCIKTAEECYRIINDFMSRWV